MTPAALKRAFRVARRPESLGLDAQIMELDRKILALQAERVALAQQQIAQEELC